MTTTPDRCPLCGGMEHDRYHACDNPKCELPVRHWPRVAELVAIRDAAVAWAEAFDLRSDTHDECWATNDRLMALVRVEVTKK